MTEEMSVANESSFMIILAGLAASGSMSFEDSMEADEDRRYWI